MPYQRAAGKLISAIQKEWGDDLGEGPRADFSERVMGAALDLLKGGTPEKTKTLLGPLFVKQYLGEVWVKSHPEVTQAVLALEELIGEKS